jgi:outer membrane protein
MQANAHYYLGTEGQVNPWVGLGVGTAYNVQRTEIGFYAVVWEPWSFALSPQIGVDLPITLGTDFMLGVRYNYWMNSENKAPLNYSYLGFNVGFRFTPF